MSDRFEDALAHHRNHQQLSDQKERQRAAAYRAAVRAHSEELRAFVRSFAQIATRQGVVPTVAATRRRKEFTRSTAMSTSTYFRHPAGWLLMRSTVMVTPDGELLEMVLSTRRSSLWVEAVPFDFRENDVSIYYRENSPTIPLGNTRFSLLAADAPPGPDLHKPDGADGEYTLSLREELLALLS